MSNKCQKHDGNIKDARRNSAHFGTQTVPRGPLFDHFPGFNNFVKFGVPGSIPHVCFFLGFSGAAQSFFRGKNRPFPKLEKVPKNLECPLWGPKPKLFAPKFCTFWYPYRPVGTFIWPFPGFQQFWQNRGSWFNSSCVFFSRFFWGGAKLFPRQK